ncbi:MAG TPA: hypothetical protein VIL37_21325 [Natronosporangium sp.]
MSAKTRGNAGPPVPDAQQLVTDFGGPLLAATDPLAAELLAATVLALPYREATDPQVAELFVETLIDAAGRSRSAEAAALLRAIAAVAPPHQRRRAVAALGSVTRAGFYPPEWAAEIGRVTPREAWRRFDVFEDTETIAVSYGYGEAEHAVLVQIDKCREPTVLEAMVVNDLATLRSALAEDSDPLVRVESLGLADARARLAPALARHPAETPGLSETTMVSLPVARTRLRRLPADGATEPARYDAADRAAAVSEFLGSPQAADAGDEKVARFWAEVFAGYSAYVPGDPPARIGTLKLSQVLLSYVPHSFALTDEQRRGLPAAVTAWTRWAAERQRLDQPAASELDRRLPEVLDRFDEAYDDPAAALARGYLADVSATTTDAAVLSDVLNRRALAVPLPAERDPAAKPLDAADPAVRRSLVERAFGECQPPAGMSQPEFVAAAVRVCEQLWQDDPAELWQRAQQLLAAGTTPHDVIHRLVTV